eukprot:COSAG02_NODE_880_length_16242_cov_5.512946_1_plen_242_part_10
MPVKTQESSCNPSADPSARAPERPSCVHEGSTPGDGGPTKNPEPTTMPATSSHLKPKTTNAFINTVLGAALVLSAAGLSPIELGDKDWTKDTPVLSVRGFKKHDKERPNRPDRALITLLDPAAFLKMVEKCLLKRLKDKLTIEFITKAIVGALEANLLPKLQLKDLQQFLKKNKKECLPIKLQINIDEAKIWAAAYANKTSTFFEVDRDRTPQPVQPCYLNGTKVIAVPYEDSNAQFLRLAI